MLEALGLDSVVLGISVGGSVAGLAVIAWMYHQARSKPEEKDLEDIVNKADLHGLGNSFRVKP